MADSYKHPHTRAHIPSKEEAGTESANEHVRQASRLDLPKNPVVHRGQDPELFWMNKYGADELDDRLSVDIRSLYRHEHVSPEMLIKSLYRMKEDSAAPDLFSVNELFGNALERDEMEKVSDYYKHRDGWSNRLIQGDSLLVMSSLLEREGMAGQVQCIYIDPPYGIKYNSNWQMKLNDRNVKDGSDDHLSGEPEMIKAFRDTWELGIHSYLTYLRDRLLVARELLTDTGSCFVQISDENVHLVRNLMDEVFGSENFVSLITFRTTTGLGLKTLDKACDYVIWYAKDVSKVKYRSLYQEKDFDAYKYLYSKIELQNGERISIRDYEKKNGLELREKNLPPLSKIYTLTDLRSQSGAGAVITIGGQDYTLKSGSFKTNQAGISKLEEKNRIEVYGNSPKYVRYYDDFPFEAIDNIWGDQMSEQNKDYVVQTSLKVIQRCILMSTDPGDLVLDPTCGSGTSAYVAEQWGRRWITIDTSRIALNIAKTRLMTATFPYYHLYSEVEIETQHKDGKIYKDIRPKSNAERDIRQGFVYEEVPHITLKSLANDEPPGTETLYDKPYEDKKRLRVAGPFTVETLQNFEPVSPGDIATNAIQEETDGRFEERIFEHLRSAGIKNGIRNEQANFVRVERLAHAYLHAEGFYKTAVGERKAYIHIGPKFGTVSKKAVNEAIKECRSKGDADWLVILGFSFESDVVGSEATTSLGSFEVSKVRMHDDLMQDGLLKKDKKAGSFMTIGEVDIDQHRSTSGSGSFRKGESVELEIKGLDIYDPFKDEVKPRSVADIAYWMVDDDYDGSNFIVKQVYFCGGEKDEFAKWKKGLDDLAKQATKRKAEQTLKIEIDDDAFDRLYGFRSHPITIQRDGQKIAVRVISQFGEESMRVVG